MTEAGVTANPATPAAGGGNQSSTNRHWKTTLIQLQPQVPRDFRSLVPAVYRGSTITFDTVASVADDWRAETQGYTYGLYGTPNTLDLAKRIAEIEHAKHTFLVPGGQAAIALIYLSFCKAGSHALSPKNVYGPSEEIATDLLAGLNIEVEYYDPSIGSDISKLIRSNTSLIWCETPGSVTMEIPDVPAIASAARERGVPVALDNTYAAGVLFDAFAHGVDISMQALTKYVGGHSDLLLGSISVNNAEAYERIGSIHRLMGMAVSPDDCALAYRGLQTLAVRLEHVEQSGLNVAKWLKQHQEITLVLHPALPDCSGHEIWKRDFTGSNGLFSIVFADTWDLGRVSKFVEALQLFKIGMSWGGAHSLVMPYPTMTRHAYGCRLIRLHVGLEEVNDLIHDLEHAFACAAGLA